MRRTGEPKSAISTYSRGYMCTEINDLQYLVDSSSGRVGALSSLAINTGRLDEDYMDLTSNLDELQMDEELRAMLLEFSGD
jgi:hypothetical protein